MRLPRAATAFPLSSGLKRPRERCAKHLDFVRSLPCCLCGAEAVAAHVRMGKLEYGKPGSGAGEKPSDKYTVPLCPRHHTDGNDAQHAHGERDWWDRKGIDPVILSALLWQVTGDRDAALSIIRLRPRRVFAPPAFQEAP